MRIGLVLLNFNEIEAVPDLLTKLDTSLFQNVIAIDGGSIDGSRELLQKSGIRVILQSSKGRGDAFRLGFCDAQISSLDALVFLSTDGNENSDDLSKFVSGLNAGYDLVIGSRMIAGARNEEDNQLFRPRKMANKTLAIFAHKLFGRRSRKITDPINGFRGITFSAWERMQVSFQGYDIEFATSIRAYQLDLKVLEFPTIEKNRIGGESGAHAVPTIYLMLRVIYKMLLKKD